MRVNAPYLVVSYTLRELLVIMLHANHHYPSLLGWYSDDAGAQVYACSSFSPCDINGEKFHGAAICSKFILNHVILYRIHVQIFVSREV